MLDIFVGHCCLVRFYMSQVTRGRLLIRCYTHVCGMLSICVVPVFFGAKLHAGMSLRHD